MTTWRRLSETQYRLGDWQIDKLPITGRWLIKDWCKDRFWLEREFYSKELAMRYVERNLAHLKPIDVM